MLMPKQFPHLFIYCLSHCYRNIMTLPDKRTAIFNPTIVWLYIDIRSNISLCDHLLDYRRPDGSLDNMNPTWLFYFRINWSLLCSYRIILFVNHCWQVNPEVTPMAWCLRKLNSVNSEVSIWNIQTHASIQINIVYKWGTKKKKNKTKWVDKYPVGAYNFATLSTSQIWSVLSHEPKTTCLPSGKNATDDMVFVCPWNSSPHPRSEVSCHPSSRLCAFHQARMRQHLCVLETAVLLVSLSPHPRSEVSCHLSLRLCTFHQVRMWQTVPNRCVLEMTP